MGRSQELLDAAREGDKKIVEKILGQITKRSGPFTSLRRGAGVNVQDDNGYTPLHHACLNGHKEIVALLLSVDASPCIADKKGASALHLAAWKGDAELVSMLLNHRHPAANIDQMTSDQETALLIAAQFGNVDVVASLLSRGANVDLRNCKGESPLDLAAQYGRLDTVQHLIQSRPQLVEPYALPLSRKRMYDTTPLHRASKNGHREVVSTLITAGFDPNVRTLNGTALHEAATFGKASVVRTLLNKGADLHATDRSGRTVQHLLNEYSEEATRRVRRIIREHIAANGYAYESEDDLPPFPPVNDYSPTGYPTAGIGSGRRRWDEGEGTSEGDALSLSSAASSCAPHHLVQHMEYNKVSPTPPKKPPRRNLSVSPTHANSPSGYSYDLRPHARSQDDLDDIQGAKNYLKHGRSVDQYVNSKLSYSEYEETQTPPRVPRVPPVPNPRPSLKTRTQPVAITAMYENVIIKEQNPKRKLKRNSGPQYEGFETNEVRSRIQERSSVESLLDDSMSPSDCERYYEGPRVDIPLSPSHYNAPPTPDHPPPSAKQAENSIHERIRPLSQEYKRRSALRNSYTETEVVLLRVPSAVSVASGATDNCVEEYVCDVPFAGLFKGSTTTLDGIGLRPMPAERPKTLKKLKSVYDTSPSEAPTSNFVNITSNGNQHNQNDRQGQGNYGDKVNGEDGVRRRSNTSSSCGDKSLSILSPFDEQEEWAKISEIMASFGSKLVRESVFVSELEQEFTSRLGVNRSEWSPSPSCASSLGSWLGSLGLADYESLLIQNGYDDVDFINGIIDETDLKEMGIDEADRTKILDTTKQLPNKILDISNNYNNITSQNENVDKWLRDIKLEEYSDIFRRHLYVDMERVRRIWDVELTAVLEIQKVGHRKRILASVCGLTNGPVSNLEDINADLQCLKNNIQLLKDDIKVKLPDNLKPVPPPTLPATASETLKRSKKKPAPQPPKASDLEIRAPSELLVGVPGALKTQWKHQPFVLVTGAVTYVANYLGSTVVKELKGTESTKKSIQKLKKSTKEPRDSPDIILSISYRGVKFLNTVTRELVCEHEVRNIHCACQDADDLTHFAYITKDHDTKSHYCHVFRVATMEQATEVILTLGEAFEVAYQMALRDQSNRVKTPNPSRTPTHDSNNKERPQNHGRSHSITEIKLNGHQLKLAPIPTSLSTEDFQSTRSGEGHRSPRNQMLKAPIASTEEL